MPLVRKETVFSIAEQRHVSIACPHCGTEVVLDMAKYEPPGLTTRMRMRFAPAACPACKAPYDSALNALEDLQRAYAALSQFAGVVSFRAGEEKSDEQ